MGFVKDIKEIKLKVNEMTEKTIDKARKHDELLYYLKDVKINLKNVYLFVNSDGSIGVNVDYSVPNIKIMFDGDGSVIKNKRFVAMNMLNLISIEDMNKISEKINEASQRNKK